MLSDLNDLIKTVLAKQGKDHRSCFVSVSLRRPDASMILLECSDPAVLSGIQAAAGTVPGDTPPFKPVLLPDPAAGLPAAAVVRTTVTDVHGQPVASSERVSQLILGRRVTPLKTEGGWTLVGCDDGYIGWVRGRDLSTTGGDGEEEKVGRNAASDRVSALKSTVYTEPSESSQALIEVLMDSRLNCPDAPKRGWRSVLLPGGRSGYIRSRHLEPATGRRRMSRRALAATGLRLLGIPYVWGGTSTRGFDCSGLIQAIYRFRGLLLPRDSDQQAAFGSKRRSNSLETLKTGDLLFFSKPDAPISHVGMYLSDGLYLHASGQVRLSSMVPDHPLYDLKLASWWRFTRDPLAVSVTM